MTHWPRLILSLLLLASLSAFADEATQADAALNANYKALSSKLDGANQQRLRDAQRAWIAFRDKECSFRARGGDGGSASALASSSCIAELSQQRADALKRQLDCPEGDVTCVPRDRAAPAAAAADVACGKSAGRQKAELLVQQCQQVSPATHPPCNVANACALMTDEIKRGCAMIDKNAPAFCADYAK
ncbi:MAG TPA: lysozyme inhibitor LprI family protein [Dokdonella sp.]